MKESAAVTIGSGNGAFWLFIVFLVLKLTHVIDWSWLWVTSPLWIPILLVVAILVIILGVVIFLLLIGLSLGDVKEKIRRKIE
jgi:hypothetical protein